MANTPPYLVIRSSTWTRDSCGLFDFEKNNLTVDRLHSTADSCIIYRANNTTYLKHPSMFIDDPAISCITKKQGRFILKPPEAGDIWLVASSLPDQKYQLEEEDSFKLGRVHFKVRSLGSFNSHSSKSQFECAHEGGTCRVCLSCDMSSDDIMISPCSCIGSVGSIHLSCLQTWLFNKAIITEHLYYTTFVWDAFRCEICKAQYPDEVKVNGRRYDLLPQGAANSVSLELIGEEMKIVYVINPRERSKLDLGRNRDCQVRINDISVSRVHASLLFGPQGVVLKDKKSKFGTLIKLDNPVELVHPLTVQAGRSILNFSLSRAPRWYDCFFPCTGCTEIPNRNTEELEIVTTNCS